VVALEHFPPGAVAELRRLRGRPDDVGEQNGGENAIRLFVLPAAGLPDVREETLDLCGDATTGDAEGKMPCAGDLGQPAPGIREAT
jgi:hypothetical protein